MQLRNHKEKRLHKGGVGPEIRSPAGLIVQIIGTSIAKVKIRLSQWHVMGQP